MSTNNKKELQEVMMNNPYSYGWTFFQKTRKNESKHFSPHTNNPRWHKNGIKQYDGKAGEWGIYNKTCRNHILPLLKNKGNGRHVFGISVPTQKEAENITNGITYIEKFLNLTNSKMEIIGEKKNQIIFKVNKEWVKTPIRASFLTMLLKTLPHKPETENVRDWLCQSVGYHGASGAVKCQWMFDNKQIPDNIDWEWKDISPYYSNGVGALNTPIKIKGE